MKWRALSPLTPAPAPALDSPRRSPRENFLRNSSFPRSTCLSPRASFLATALIIGDEQQREPSFGHLEHKARPFFPLSGNCTRKARGWLLRPDAQSVSLPALR